MKRLTSVIILTLIASLAIADPNPVAPNPASIVVTVGQWIVDAIKQNKTYHITVEAEGRDLQEAKLEAFRLAVDRAVGSLLSAETEVKNQDSVRHEVVSYSSGYVERYEIKSQKPTDSGVKVQVEVWVSGTSIQNRLLSSSRAAGIVEGNQASVTIESYDHNRATGDKTLDLVLADYPKRAFKITPQPTQVKVDAYRNYTLIVPMTVVWDYAYLLSLGQVLKAVKDNYLTNNLAQVKIVAKDPNDFTGWTQVAGFNDIQKYQLLYTRLVESRPVMQVKILNKMGDVVMQNCYSWPDFNGQYLGADNQFLDASYNGQNYLMNIYGHHRLNANVVMPITAESVQDLDHVVMEVLPAKNCKK